MLPTDLSPKCQRHRLKSIYTQLIMVFIIILFGVLVLIYNLSGLNFFE